MKGFFLEKFPSLLQVLFRKFPWSLASLVLLSLKNHFLEILLTLNLREDLLRQAWSSSRLLSYAERSHARKHDKVSCFKSITDSE